MLKVEEEKHVKWRWKNEEYVGREQEKTWEKEREEEKRERSRKGEGERR